MKDSGVHENILCRQGSYLEVGQQQGDAASGHMVQHKLWSSHLSEGCEMSKTACVYCDERLLFKLEWNQSQENTTLTNLFGVGAGRI